MGKFIGALFVLIVLAGGGVLAWYLTHPPAEPTELVLYGNVDLRQVQLAFNNSERIIDVKVQEGDRVKKDDRLAVLDTRRLAPKVAEAVAQVAAQEEALKRLEAGSRPEEIEQAEANLEAAKIDADNCREKYERLKSLAAVPVGDKKKLVEAASKEDVDNARAALRIAEAKLVVQQKAWKLAKIGPRQEDKDEARAKLQANRQQLEFLQQQLTDATLLAPCDAVVRSRLMEPGEMSSPQKAVFSLAVISPKWVRAYVAEPDLGKIRPGMKAWVTIDSFPAKKYEGYFGFISNVAEFTPKTVQTVDLRTSLVYEVRVYVTDTADELRLGMPATIHVPLDQPAPSSAK